MFDYKLSLIAKEDLKRIYEYGLLEFGEEQADDYFYKGFRQIDKIVTNPYLYQSVDHLRPGYRRCTYQSDSIYYRINGHTVEIMAILGGQELGDWL